jgi:hypothetical protein
VGTTGSVTIWAVELSRWMSDIWYHVLVQLTSHGSVYRKSRCHYLGTNPILKLERQVKITMVFFHSDQQISWF